jgi:hypothetical protein
MGPWISATTVFPAFIVSHITSNIPEGGTQVSPAP